VRDDEDDVVGPGTSAGDLLLSSAGRSGDAWGRAFSTVDE